MLITLHFVDFSQTFDCRPTSHTVTVAKMATVIVCRVISNSFLLVHLGSSYETPDETPQPYEAYGLLQQ